LVAVPQTLHLIPTQRRHEPNTAPLPATERAPPRASGSAYGCTTKALAGEGPIAVPHTAARDDLQERRSTARRLLLRPGGAGVRGGRSGAFGPRPAREACWRQSGRPHPSKWSSEASCSRQSCGLLQTSDAGTGGPVYGAVASEITMSSFVLSTIATSSARSRSGTLNFARVWWKSSMNASHSWPVISSSRCVSSIERPE
jgi:hypothetical protein